MTEQIPGRRIFLASFMTLIAAGVGFAVRGGILREWGNQFGFTQLELGTITGGGLVGFGLVILAASLITDRVGYKALLILAFVLHLLSAVVTLAATPTFNALGQEATYWCLYVGMFMFAAANGLCEAVINPLAATLYPKQKTHYLNILHAGWPGGLILGGLLGALIVGRVRWEVPMALFLVPVVIYGVMILGVRFPISEARAAGVAYGQMLRELASPILLFLLLLHAGIGYVELGTDSWITNITNSILTGQGFLLFVYASSIMFVLRFFAGPIVERINPLGLLFCSAVVACIGLLMLGSVASALLVWGRGHGVRDRQDVLLAHHARSRGRAVPPRGRRHDGRRRRHRHAERGASRRARDRLQAGSLRLPIPAGGVDARLRALCGAEGESIRSPSRRSGAWTARRWASSWSPTVPPSSSARCVCSRSRVARCRPSRVSTSGGGRRANPTPASTKAPSPKRESSVAGWRSSGRPWCPRSSPWAI